MADAWGSPVGDTISREGVGTLPGFGGVPSGINNITGPGGGQRLIRPPTTQIPTPPRPVPSAPSVTQIIFSVGGIGASTALNYLGQQKIQQAGGQVSGIGGLASGVQASYQNIAGNLQGQVNAIRTEYQSSLQSAQAQAQAVGQAAFQNAIQQEYGNIRNMVQTGAITPSQASAAAVAAQQAAQQAAQAAAQQAYASQAAQAQADAQAKTSAASAAASQQARQAQEQAKQEAQRRIEQAKQLINEGASMQQASPYAGSAVTNIGGFIDNPNLATGAKVVGPAVAAGIPLALGQPVPNPIQSALPIPGLGGGNLLGALSTAIQGAGAFAEYGNQPGLATSVFTGIGSQLVPGWALGQSIYNNFETIQNAYNSQLYNSALTDRYQTGQTLGAVGSTLSQLGSLAGSAFLPVGGGIVGSLIGVPFTAYGAAESQSAIYESNVYGVNPGSITSSLYQPLIQNYSDTIATTAAIKTIPLVGSLANFFGFNDFEAPSVNVVPSQYGDAYYGLGETGKTLNTSFTSETGANVLALAQANGLNVMINGDNVQIDLTGATPDQLASFYSDLNNAWEKTMTEATIPLSEIFDPLSKTPTLEGAEQIEITADSDKPYVFNEKGEVVRNPYYDSDGDGVPDGEEGYDTDTNQDGIPDYQQRDVRGDVPSDAKDSGQEDSVNPLEGYDGSLPPPEPRTPGAQSGGGTPPPAPAPAPKPPAPRPTTPTQETGAYRGNTIGGGRGLRR